MLPVHERVNDPVVVVAWLSARVTGIWRGELDAPAAVTLYERETIASSTNDDRFTGLPHDGVSAKYSSNDYGKGIV